MVLLLLLQDLNISSTTAYHLSFTTEWPTTVSSFLVAPTWQEWKKKRKKRKEATFVKVERTLNLQGEKVSAKWMIMFPRVNLVCENLLCNNPDSHVCCTLPICQTYFLKVKPNTDPCSVARCCYFRNILRKNVGDKTLFWRQDASCGFSMHFLQNTQSHWFIYNLICVFFLLNTNVSTCTA